MFAFFRPGQPASTPSEVGSFFIVCPGRLPISVELVMTPGYLREPLRGS